MIYRLRVGTFFIAEPPAQGRRFLDVARKLPYLADLGVTALQLHAHSEFQTSFQPGAQMGTDYFFRLKWTLRWRMLTAGLWAE